MKRKLIQALLITASIIAIPILLNIDFLRAPHLWILISIGILSTLLQPNYNPFQKSTDTRDRGTAQQIIWSIYFSLFIALFEAAYYRYPESVSWTSVNTISLIIMLAGLALRTWGVYTLGTFFTWHISVNNEQKIIESGPYAFVRHPGYLGAFMTYGSTAIFLKAWCGILPSILLLLFAFSRRIHYEEQELKHYFPTQYEAYSQRAGRFFPKLR